MKRFRQTAILAAFSAGLICLAVYLRALSCGFVNWDDAEYVLNKAALRHLDSELVITAFTQPLFVLWKPLTFISYALDYHFWGLNPLGYHLTNILLHAVSTGLVVLVADRLLRQGQVARAKDLNEGTKGLESYLYPTMLLLAGLLWGIHPLRVESVAWISCRKDVLNGVFSLGSMLCYLRYAQQKGVPGENGGALRNYLVSLILFLCSLMAKPVSVILPLMLLVADWYPLERLHKGSIRSVLVEKLPYLILSAGITIISLSLAIQRGGLRFSDKTVSFGDKVLLSGNAVFEYVRLMLFPAGIQPLYIIPDPLPAAYLVKTVIVAVICVFVYAFRKHGWLTATWLCFLVSVLPVLAFFQVNAAAFAARYSYLPAVVPSIAMAAITVGVVDSLAGRVRFSRFLFVVLVAAVPVVHGVVTVDLIGAWRNSLTLWSDAVAKSPDNYAAWDALGGVYRSAGQTEEALRAFENGLARNASDGDLLYDLGDLYTELGQLDKGAAYLKRLLELHPKYVMGWAELGNNYLKRGKYSEAQKAYQHARALQPEAVEVTILLGDLARIQGRLDVARDFYNQVEAKNRNNAENAYKLACVEAREGRKAEALSWLEKALQRGYRDYDTLISDAELSALWEEPRFNYLLAQYFPELSN